ncbi:beta-phosphoglucomutase [Litchfieldia alkalitelluris]|uniref:beta-phosphoglucomutase n=1 Tax=Litchfieldia alkalitelluris TaxID=304268 RepID=UPI000995F1F9|nr:beta-phosphoglucomutase [Litchfieldia alkalitelluris]
MSKQLQAFIFDLDGVITDTAEYHFMAWKALAEDLGIEFTRESNEELKGISRMESLEKILQIGGKANVYSDEEKEQLATKKNEHYVELIQKISPKDILPGIEELLKRIKHENLKLALASASKNAVMVLDSLELKDMFDIIVDVSKIKRGKPDPEIFLTAASQLEVDPSYCIGVEDALAGVDAIKDAGMFAVAIGPDFQRADLVYRDTSGLSFDEIRESFSKK